SPAAGTFERRSCPELSPRFVSNDAARHSFQKRGMLGQFKYGKVLLKVGVANGNASHCRSIPTRCRRGQTIGREGNVLLRARATSALGRAMAATGRLQDEIGIQAAATIKLTLRKRDQARNSKGTRGDGKGPPAVSETPS